MFTNEYPILDPSSSAAVYYPPENKGKLESHTREPEDIYLKQISGDIFFLHVFSTKSVQKRKKATHACQKICLQKISFVLNPKL